MRVCRGPQWGGRGRSYTFCPWGCGAIRFPGHRTWRGEGSSDSTVSPSASCPPLHVAHTRPLQLLCLPACLPAQGPPRTSSSSQCFWIPITICRRPSVEQTSWGTCGMRHRMSPGERLVLEGSPIQLLEVALSGQLVLMGPRPRCPCGHPLAPGLPPSIPTPLPGLHCFRACPRPKGEVPGSDGCPEPPRCFGECAWHRGWRTSGSWW